MAMRLVVVVEAVPIEVEVQDLAAAAAVEPIQLKAYQEVLVPMAGQEEAAAIKAQMDEELRLMEEELEEQVLPRQLLGVSVGRG